ncbi:uncharacterized protein (TIGR02246 family) [Haloactinopolyspora alba]|uniref:Uncharacterized protein (TIGR02246 family) n=1 Tax=Haloactinopolyspora alba TaxID=648780 RepID=A0A2P8DKX4_9ACTN|nr:SgcJ/EcaC family oxidoreductase [Haloactinopolyspora alba]PSK97870.1 uncharacterized protein (TIGR02246 family) [Haloactinopolyspora alba]
MGANHATTRDDDRAAIRQVVAEAEKHQNDLEAFLALHTADAMIVNIAGRRVLGRDDIRVAMAAALDSPLASVFTTTEIVDIRFASADVAIVSAIKHVSDERGGSSKAGSGEGLPATGSLTYVLAREHDAWRIASAQTTPIVQADADH